MPSTRWCLEFPQSAPSTGKWHGACAQQPLGDAERVSRHMRQDRSSMIEGSRPRGDDRYRGSPQRRTCRFVNGSLLVAPCPPGHCYLDETYRNPMIGGLCERKVSTRHFGGPQDPDEAEGTMSKPRRASEWSSPSHRQQQRGSASAFDTRPLHEQHCRGACHLPVNWPSRSACHCLSSIGGKASWPREEEEAGLRWDSTGFPQMTCFPNSPGTGDAHPTVGRPDTVEVPVRAALSCGPISRELPVPDSMRGTAECHIEIQRQGAQSRTYSPESWLSISWGFEVPGRLATGPKGRSNREISVEISAGSVF